MRKRDSLLARLLSGRDAMSRPEKERILEAVLAAAERPRRARRAVVAGMTAAAAVAALVLFGPWGRGPDPTPEFAARGDRGGEGPGFQLLCASDACRLGERAAIDVWDWGARPYFAALARGPGDLVVWYFPETAEGQSLDLRRRSVDGLLDTAISLGEPHRAGELRLVGVFSAAPLTRAEVRSILTAGRPGEDGPRVVERKVTLR